MLPVKMTWEVLLSVFIGVEGLGYPISIRVVQVGTACWSLRKIVLVSALAADAMTVRVVWNLARIVPFEVGVGRMGGVGGVSLR